MGLAEIIVYILFVFSVLASITVTVLDKYFARHRMRRIKEKHLLIIGVLGSTVAMYTTMRIIKHKTRHDKFMYGLPLVALFKFVFLAFFYTQL